MARPLKKAAKAQDSLLTPDNVIEIPVEEQPYPLPEGWKWVTLSTVAKWGAGGTPSRKHPEYYSGKISWVKTGELRDYEIYSTEEHITQEAISNSSAKIFPPDTVIIAMYGATIGKVGILKIDAATNQACACAICYVFTYYKYLFLYLLSQKDEFIKRGKGGAQPNISQEVIKKYPIPLPPIETQQRIVDRIESLFAKLDEAKEKAEAVLDGFESRKAAILHKAFTGELTAKWREEKGITLTDWKNLTLNDIAEYRKGPFGSSITKAMFVPKGKDTYKVYEQGNAIRKTLSYGSYYISKEKFNELSSFSVEEGDIIISCAGTIGEIYKLPYGSEKGVINQALMRVRVYSNTDERFFEYYFSGILKGDIIDKANGTAIKNIPPFKVMKAMPIHLPLLSEQREIIRLLDSLLEKEQQAKEAAEIVLEQITVMKKAILARAFRGELTGQVHNEKQR